jgi:peptidyl-prolyl cis-trans isomerase D
MLQSIRSGIGSWITKAFLGLIILSFAVWGVGDILRGPRDRTVLSVGNLDVPISQFQSELRLVQAQLGPNFDMERARELGIIEMTTRRLIERSLLDVAVADLGLAVSDDLIKQQILANPAFRNSLGRFDPLIFEQAVASIGMNEQMYVAASRQDTARDQLMSSVADGGAVSRLLAESLYAYRSERRVAELLVIPHSSLAEVGDPDEAALAEFHQAQAARFTAPEYRALTFFTLDPQDLMAEVRVSDDQLRDEYELRLDDYVTPERRDLDQMVLDDEVAARAAHDALQAGQDFAQVATAATGLSADELSLGLVAADELPLELAEAVFALPAGALSEPLESPFGWHLFRVNAAQPGGTLAYEEVRDALATELKLELANKVEDELAGGAALEETATRLGLKLGTVAAVDAQGRDQAGAAAAGLPAEAQFLAAAFDAETGLETPLSETSGGGYFILRVDRVIPPTLRPLDSVRDEVGDAWRGQRRAEAARKAAEAIAERVKGGAELAALGAEQGYSVRTTAALARDGYGLDPAVSPLALTHLFGLAVGEVATAAAPNGQSHVVARLQKIQDADPAGDAEAIERLTEELRQAVGNDLLAQYAVALEADYGVSIDRASIDALLDLTPRRGF